MSGGKSGLEPLEENESSEHHQRVKFHAVQGIGNEIGELGIQAGGSGRVLRACKQMLDELSTKVGCVFMTVVRIRF